MGCRCRKKTSAPIQIFEYFSSSQGEEKYYEVKFKQGILIYVEEVPYRFSLNQRVQLSAGLLHYIRNNVGYNIFFFLSRTEEVEFNG